MNAIKLARKYPEFTQAEVLSLVQQFTYKLALVTPFRLRSLALSRSAIDVNDSGALPKATVLTSLSAATAAQSPAGQYSYDQVRETLKLVSLDASGNVELDDWVDLVSKLKSGKGEGAGKVLRGGALKGLVAGVGAVVPSAGGSPSGGGKVLVAGSNSNVSHTINEDERTEFTRHINQVGPPSHCLRTALTRRRRSSLVMLISETDSPFPPIRCKSLTNVEVSVFILIRSRRSGANGLRRPQTDCYSPNSSTTPSPIRSTNESSTKRNRNLVLPLPAPPPLPPPLNR